MSLDGSATSPLDVTTNTAFDTNRIQVPYTPVNQSSNAKLRESLGQCSHNASGDTITHNTDSTLKESSNNSKIANNDRDSEEWLTPDGGYAWMIMCASFMIQFIVGGVTLTFGVFYLEFLDQFDENKDITAVAGSALNGMCFFVGPIASTLANNFGCRPVCIVGSLMSSGALLLSTFATNIYMLIITYGVITGFGFGLMYLPSLVMVGVYFEKRRALATGVIICGTSIGAFVFPPLCERLIAIYSWRGVTMILSGISLNGIVCGAIYRPPKIPRQTRLQTTCVRESTHRYRHQEHHNTPSSNYSNYHVTVEMPNTVDFQSLPAATYSVSEDHYSNLPNPPIDRICRKLSSTQVHDLAENVTTNNDIMQIANVQNRRQNKRPHNQNAPIGRWIENPARDKREHANIMTRFRKTWKSLVNSWKEIGALMKNPSCTIYGISCFLCMSGFYVPYTYLPDMAVTYGMSREQAAFLLSIIGIANTLARPIYGWISDQPWADCIIINSVTLILAGAVTMVSPFCSTYPLLVVYSSIFGSSIAAFVGLRSIIPVELFGVNKLTSALGLVTLFQGLASFIGPPIAGALFSYTGSYNFSFYIAGSALALAGIICFPLRRVAIWWEKRTTPIEANYNQSNTTCIRTRGDSQSNTCNIGIKSNCPADDMVICNTGADIQADGLVNGETECTVF